MEEVKKDKCTWLQALIDADDFMAAEVYVSKMLPDFEKVNALLLLADAYHKCGECEIAYICASKAVTLWKVCGEEWWVFPMLGDLLRKIVACGQHELSEHVIEESVSLVENAGHAWLETHGWCGLAQGYAYLGQKEKADKFICQAIHVAKGRSTDDERSSAMSIVEDALKVLRWPLNTYELQKQKSIEE